MTIQFQANILFTDFKRDGKQAMQVGFLYGLFQGEIEKMFTREDRLEIYKEAKAKYIAWTDSSHFLKPEDKKMLTELANSNQNRTVEFMAKSVLIKKFWTAITVEQFKQIIDG